VVGAGHGGLTCAAYLAAGGLKVLVLEQYTIAGGSTQVFRRRGRYEFDVGTHYIGDCGPGGAVQGIYHGLGAEGRITFRALDPDGFDRIVLPTVTVDVPCGWADYRERMAAALPDEADAVRTYLDICIAIDATLRDSPSPLTDQAARWVKSPLDYLMRHCGLSPRARTVLAAQAANYGLGPRQVSTLAHVAMIGDYMLGAGYPEGGGQLLAATLVEVIEAHGGELRTRSRVDAITVEHGRVTGVRLAGGSLLRAPVVVSNADYRQTMLDLVGAAHLPPDTVARIGRSSMALPLVTLYLAIERDAVAPPASNIWFYEDEDINAIYAELTRGGFTEPRFAFISSGTAKGGPTGSTGHPPHHTLEVMTVCPARHAPWAAAGDAGATHAYRRDAGYLAEKDRLGRALLGIAERALGPFGAHVLHHEVSTPLTHARFTLAADGTPYGLAAFPRQFGFERPSHQTTVPGLYLVGASAHSGHGIARVMVGGVRCAELVLEQSLLAEARAGKVFGSPWLLPDRPPDWDPLRASRGSRSLRHPARSAA
jgi:all-trans-retinol 13,14-reductase